MKLLSSQFAFLSIRWSGCYLYLHAVWIQWYLVQLTFYSFWKKHEVPCYMDRRYLCWLSLRENWVQLCILLIIHDLGLKWMCIRFSLIHFIKFKTKPRSSFILGSVTSFLSSMKQSKELLLREFVILMYPRELGGELAFITPPPHIRVCTPSLSLSLFPSLTQWQQAHLRGLCLYLACGFICVADLQFINLESIAQFW